MVIVVGLDVLTVELEVVEEEDACVPVGIVGGVVFRVLDWAYVRGSASVTSSTVDSRIIASALHASTWLKILISTPFIANSVQVYITLRLNQPG